MALSGGAATGYAEGRTCKVTPPGSSMQAIDAAYFEVNRKELLARCPGRWVVIFDGKLLGDWETFAEAYGAGIRLANSEDIHLRQVVPKDQEPVISIPALALGVMGPVKYTPRAPLTGLRAGGGGGRRYDSGHFPSFSQT